MKCKLEYIWQSEFGVIWLVAWGC